MSEEKIQTEKKAEIAPEIKPGMTVKVHEKIKEKNAKGVEKERIQVFEGLVIARKHGKEIGSTITVRKVSNGIGVEKIYPLNSPLITNIEPVKQAKVRRAKLGFVRTAKKKFKETKI
ncbi:50S ribosomal protein L19 [Candidatus Nomurabacteria bacterium]|nr:50S ribosomal protein L19 [Candidatus Nomurabacteria bacterium]